MCRVQADLWDFGPRDQYRYYNIPASLLIKHKKYTHFPSFLFFANSSVAVAFSFYLRCLQIKERGFSTTALWFILLQLRCAVLCSRGSQRLAGCRTVWKAWRQAQRFPVAAFATVINKTQDVFLFFPHQRSSGAAKQNNHYCSLFSFPTCSLSLTLLQYKQKRSAEALPLWEQQWGWCLRRQNKSVFGIKEERGRQRC